MIIRAVDDKLELSLDELRAVLKRQETLASDAQVDVNSSALRNEVGQVSAKPKKKQPHPSGLRPGTPSNQEPRQPSSKQASGECQGCGGRHLRKDCRFRSAICHFCRKEGHIARVCRLRTSAKNSGKRPATDSSPKEKLETSSVEISSVLTSQEALGRTYFNVAVDGQLVRFRADSGADITTISGETRAKIGSPALRPYPGNCTQVDGQTLRLKGFFTAVLGYGKERCTEPVLVLSSGSSDLLCGRALRLLELISWTPGAATSAVASIESASADVVALQTAFPTLLEKGLRCCSKLEVKLYPHDNVRPTPLPARPIALAFKEQVEKELDRLVANGTIEAVEQSDWTTPIVVVRKPNGSLRACADYSTGLNSALKDLGHPRPNMEEIMTRFSGNRIFSQLDLADAYLQLKLDEESEYHSYP